jgi:hypothetical protein
MSATLVVEHKVGDYAAWRKVYDGLEPLRAKHGCTGQRVTVGASIAAMPRPSATARVLGESAASRNLTYR